MPREQLKPFVVFCFLNDGKLLRPKRIELDKVSLNSVCRRCEWAVPMCLRVQAWSWTECLEELCLSLGAAEELGSLEIMKAIELADVNASSVLNRCALIGVHTRRFRAEHVSRTRGCRTHLSLTKWRGTTQSHSYVDSTCFPHPCCDWPPSVAPLSRKAFREPQRFATALESEESTTSEADAIPAPRLQLRWGRAMR